MAAKYHISDNGMPGKCTAANPDSCPKTQAGDSFHGTLEEATQESQNRFEEKLGAFVTSSKKDAEDAAAGEEFAGRFAAAAQKVIDNPNDPKAQSELNGLRTEMTEELRAGRGGAITGSKTYEDAEIALGEAQARAKANAVPKGYFHGVDPDSMETYVHPSGKIVKVYEDGSARAFKNGKELKTSATAEKLREGYGAWKRDDTKGAAVGDAAKPKLTPAQEDELVESYDDSLDAEKTAEAELQDVYARHRAHNAANGAAEGRAYYSARKPDGSFERRRGVNPNGGTYFDQSEGQKAELEHARKSAEAARNAAAAAQTTLEENGLGHRIPDEDHTVRVRTQAQKWLLKDELQGQISDGHWENSSNNPWEDWSNAKVVVDPKNPGRNFDTSKDNYQLNASSLLDVVGDRMVENVQTKTGKADYNERAMQGDLRDLRNIFKTRRGQVSGD